jgi:hypothetical protein
MSASESRHPSQPCLFARLFAPRVDGGRVKQTGLSFLLSEKDREIGNYLPNKFWPLFLFWIFWLVPHRMCFKLLTKTILAYFSFTPAGSEFLHAPDWTLLAFDRTRLPLIRTCFSSLFVAGPYLFPYLSLIHIFLSLILVCLWFRYFFFQLSIVECLCATWRLRFQSSQVTFLLSTIWEVLSCPLVHTSLFPVTITEVLLFLWIHI